VEAEGGTDGMIGCWVAVGWGRPGDIRLVGPRRLPSAPARPAAFALFFSRYFVRHNGIFSFLGWSPLSCAEISSWMVG
jgi:hypothetical protein